MKMRYKILLKLKELRGTTNKDVSDRTLETFATQLEATITEDGQLEAGVLPYKGLIESIQGNFNAFAAANAKKTVVDPPVIDPTVVDPPKQKGLTLEDLTAAITAAQAPLLKEINTIKGGNAKAKMIEDARLSIADKFQLEDAEMAGSNYIFDMISDRNHADLETFVSTYEAEYNKFRTANGAGNVIPKSSIVVDPNKAEVDEWAEKVKDQRKAEADKAEAANKRVNNQ